MLEADIHSKEDLEAVASENADIADNLSMSTERAILRSRSQKLKEKHSENKAKGIDLMMDIDTRVFDRMGEEKRKPSRRGLRN